MKLNKHPKGYWTIDKCIDYAKKFNSKSELEYANKVVYEVIRKNGWFNLCCHHMITLKKPNGYWSFNRCKEDALKYKSKKMWERSSVGYRQAVKNNWIEECCHHMIPIGNKYLRLVYVAIFSDNYVYVGLTSNFDERIKAHKFDSKSPINKHILTTGKLPEFKRLTDYLYFDKAVELEKYYQIEYKENGYKPLYKAKAGGLGGGVLVWTKENCINSAKQFTSKSEWYKHNLSAYKSAKKNNWFDECIKFIQNER